jgi:hypothetical protein
MYFIRKNKIPIRNNHAEKNVAFNPERELVFEVEVEFEFSSSSFVDLPFLFFPPFFFPSLKPRLLTRNVRLMMVVLERDGASVALEGAMIVTKNWWKYADWLSAELRSKDDAETKTRRGVTKRRMNENRMTRFGSCEMKKDDEILSTVFDRMIDWLKLKLRMRMKESS